MDQITTESGLKIGIEEKTAIVLGHTDPTLKVLTIPAEIEHDEKKFKVSTIFPKIFSKSELEEVNIPSSMELIGDQAFYRCEKLKKINFLDNDKEYRRRLKLLNMGFRFNGLSIGDSAFGHCDSLVEVHIPMYVREIGESVFFNCSSLEKVVWDDLDKDELVETKCYSDLPGYRVSIGKRAFSYCKKLHELKLSPLVNNISANFIEGTALSKIDLPEKRMNIDELAFAFSNLESVVFPDELAYIRYGTCMGCKYLKDVFFPSELEYIGEKAFEDCTSLTGIHIPRSVKEIHPSSFRYCSNLLKVYCSKKHVPVMKKQLSAGAVFEV